MMSMLKSMLQIHEHNLKMKNPFFSVTSALDLENKK